MKNLSILVYAAGVMALIGYANRRVQRLRQTGQLRAGDAQAQTPAGRPIRFSRGAALANSYGVFAGGVCWMVVMAALVQDWVTAIGLSAAMVAVPVATLKFFGPRYWRIILSNITVAAFLSLLTINLRWDAWMAAYRVSRFYEPTNDQPRWVMNLLLGALFAVLIVACACKERLDRKAAETTDERETGR